MNSVKFEIPQWALTTAIDGLQELARRLESDAAAYARLDTPEAHALAEDRLEQARETWRGHEFYIHL